MKPALYQIKAPALDHDAMMAKEFGSKVGERGRLERQIIAALCHHLGEQGWKPVRVYGGDDGPEKCHDAKSAMEFVFNLDDSAIRFLKGKQSHCVWIVLGNGIDCVGNWEFSEGDADGFDAAMDQFLNTYWE